ncbi:unnamed protein product [Prunus brigantina]
MKYEKKDAHMLDPKEPTHNDKLQRVARKLSLPTRRIGKTVKEICSVETTMSCSTDLESHLKHLKSVMILYKAEDELMCKVFSMTLQGATHDWFHTLPSGSISSLKKLAFIFTKERNA